MWHSSVAQTEETHTPPSLRPSHRELYVCPLPVSIISDHHVTYNSGLVCSTQRRKAPAPAGHFHIRKTADCCVHSHRIGLRSIEEDQLNTTMSFVKRTDLI